MQDGGAQPAEIMSECCGVMLLVRGMAMSL